MELMDCSDPRLGRGAVVRALTRVARNSRKFRTFSRRNRVGKRPMTHEQREAEYLRKAKEAQEQVIRVKDQPCKDGWRLIAEGYRKLSRDPRC